MSEFPRRSCIDQLTPAEKAIRDAVLAVEMAGADVRLTNAVILLRQAQCNVADFIDGVPLPDPAPATTPAPNPVPSTTSKKKGGNMGSKKKTAKKKTKKSTKTKKK